MSIDTNIAAQESLSENINNGDLDTAMRTFAPDAIDHDPAPGQAPGREGFRAFIEVRGMQIGRFENGQIVERWGSSDELGIMQQLGAEVSTKGGLAKLADRLGS